jgi:hypothetical protein
VDLQRGVRGAVREQTGVELRLRGGEAERLALVLQPRGAVHELAAGLDLGRHVCERELHRLELRDRPAELLPLLRVGEGEVVGALGEPDTHRRDRDATAVEDLHELCEPSPARAEQVPLRNGAILERELARVGRVPAELVHRRGDLIPGRAVRHDDIRDLTFAGERGDRDAGRDVGAGVRDEDLRAVDDPLSVAKVCACARRARVGAGVRLREAECGELPAGGELGEPLLLLPLVAVQEDRHRPERRVRRNRDRDRGVDARQLLDRDRVRHGVGAGAAILLRDRDAHQPELGELRHEVVRKAPFAVELLGDRRDASLGELAHGAAQQLLLVAQLVVHARLVASSAISRTP